MVYTVLEWFIVVYNSLKLLVIVSFIIVNNG